MITGETESIRNHVFLKREEESRQMTKRKEIEEGLDETHDSKMDIIDEILDVGHVIDVNDEDGFVDAALKNAGVTKQDMYHWRLENEKRRR